MPGTPLEVPWASNYAGASHRGRAEGTSTVVTSHLEAELRALSIHTCNVWFSLQARHAHGTSNIQWERCVHQSCRVKWQGLQSSAFLQTATHPSDALFDQTYCHRVPFALPSKRVHHMLARGALEILQPLEMRLVWTASICRWEPGTHASVSAKSKLKLVNCHDDTVFL